MVGNETESSSFMFLRSDDEKRERRGGRGDTEGEGGGLGEGEGMEEKKGKERVEGVGVEEEVGVRGR